MTRGDVHHATNVRDWNYFDAFNQNNDCEDNDLKNMVLNNNNNKINTNTNIINTNKNYYWTIILILILISIILLFIYYFIIRS
jgi:RsiW-degrading membrane proteinase PrsW (M82 family)